MIFEITLLAYGNAIVETFYEKHPELLPLSDYQPGPFGRSAKICGLRFCQRPAVDPTVRLTIVLPAGQKPAGRLRLHLPGHKTRTSRLSFEDPLDAETIGLRKIV